MSEEKEKDFRVIDRRSESPAEQTAKKGDGFVMKEGEATQAIPSNIDFATFIFSLATGAFIHCGEVPDQATGKVQKNLELAKQNIDLLALMKEKTKGNLSDDETKLLDSLLSEVRVLFVKASNKK